MNEMSMIIGETGDSEDSDTVKRKLRVFVACTGDFARDIYPDVT